MTEKKPPPYRKYAFANPYNYAVLGGLASAAVLTGNWWLGVVGAGYEALWMLFAPDSKLLRKLWFDKRFAAETEAAKQAAEEAKLQLLPLDERRRCFELCTRRSEIDRLAKQNPAFTVDLLSAELKKLEDLVSAFIDLSVTSARYEEYLRSIDVGDIESSERRYRQILDGTKEPEQRSLAQKNLSVMLKRKEKYGEINGYLESARGQLELIENSFRLLTDQIVTMRSPQELGGQLDELLDGVEAVRQTTRETDRLLQAVER